MQTGDGLPESGPPARRVQPVARVGVLALALLSLAGVVIGVGRADALMLSSSPGQSSSCPVGGNDIFHGSRRAGKDRRSGQADASCSTSRRKPT